MQIGFILLEAGSVRHKNQLATVVKNFHDTLICAITFFAFGFGLANNAAGGVFGTGKFFGFDYTYHDYQLFIHQFAFCQTSATIVSGSLAERVHLDAYLMFSFIMSGFIYPVISSWVFGGGWLFKLGFKDFAGSTVVHITGGAAGLVGAIMLQPRLNYYPNSKHNLRFRSIYKAVDALKAYLIITNPLIKSQFKSNSPGSKKQILNNVSIHDIQHTLSNVNKQPTASDN